MAAIKLPLSLWSCQNLKSHGVSTSLKVSLWFNQRGFLQPSSPTLFALLIKLPSADYVLSLFRLVIFFTILLLCLLSCYQKFILWCSGNHCLQREFFNISFFQNTLDQVTFSILLQITDTRTHAPCFLVSGQRPTGATFEFLGTVFLCASVWLCVCLCGGVCLCAVLCVPVCGAKSSRDAGSSLRDTRLLVRCADPLLGG